MRGRFVEVVHHLGVVIKEDLEDVPAEGERQAQVVTVVVVGDVFPPVGEAARDVGLGVLAAGHVDIDLLVPSIHLEDGRDQDDGIVADGPDERRLVHRDAVGQFHQHLDRPGLAGMHPARGIVNGLGLADETPGFAVAERARVGEAGVDPFVAVQVGHRPFIGHGDYDPIPAFLGFPEGQHLDTRRGGIQRPHVFINIR